MSPFPKPGTTALFLAALFAAPVAAAGPPAPANPVEDFRAALLQPLGPGGANDRKADLLKRLDALGSPGQLAEALGLDFWQDEGNARPIMQQQEEAMRVDQEVHAVLVERFVKRIRKASSADDAGTRAAAVTLIGSAAAAERALRENGRFNGPGFVKPGPAPVGPFAGLAPDLIQRTKDDDTAVRQAAVRALVEVGADAEKAEEAIGGLLQGDGKDKDPSVRRAAAAALGGLLEEAERKNARTLGLVPEEETGFLQLEIRTVPIVVQGLGDGDAEVQRLCLAALRQAPNALNDLAAYPWVSPGPSDFPGRDATVLVKQVQDKGRMLRSLADALNKALPDATNALKGEPGAAVAASEVLEAAVEARGRMRRWQAALPPEPGADKPSADPLPALLAAREPLAKNLSAKEVRVRLAAVYVLEAFGPEAAPASKTLAEALTTDADSFVRWGAARALGKMAPNQPDDAVPALAKALEDKNEDVRLTAAVALRRFGPAAKGAVGALAAAVKRDDGVRLEALQALADVGTTDASAATEAAAALADPDAVVRVAAAHALAHLGPLDDASRAALRTALLDADEAVRGAAAAALLSGK